MPVRDRAGEQHGRLLVLRDTGQRWNGKAVWLCACDCGAETLARSDDLGVRKQSCGCLQREAAADLARALVAAAREGA